MESTINTLNQYLVNNGFFADSLDNNCQFVTIDISWGDWKHDHMRCDQLVSEWAEENGLGVIVGETEVTEEDGSDCYSATHNYFIYEN